MRYIGKDDIARVLTFPRLIAALDEGHRRPKIEIRDTMLGTPEQCYYVRNAVDAGRYFVSKLITSFPANLAGGTLPAVQALVVLFDARNGRPLAVMDGTEITCWRTAADSALGANYLAREDARTLLVVGAGAMAPWLVRAHRAVRPSIARVMCWNRTEPRAAQLAEALAAEGTVAVPVAHLEDAVRSADIVTTCTRANAPLICGRWLKAGAHLDLVGGYDLNTREADDDCIGVGRVFVDRRETAMDVADIAVPLESGILGEKEILGDLYDLAGARGRPRRSPSEVTIFKNAGGAHLDLMTAELVFRLLDQ
jgi:ornithine cyclodeaminase/alanine dehydrogenase-like protein (mu-crystallin family)